MNFSFLLMFDDRWVYAVTLISDRLLRKTFCSTNYFDLCIFQFWNFEVEVNKGRFKQIAVIKDVCSCEYGCIGKCGTL